MTSLFQIIVLASYRQFKILIDYIFIFWRTISVFLKFIKLSPTIMSFSRIWIFLFSLICLFLSWVLFISSSLSLLSSFFIRNSCSFCFFYSSTIFLFNSNFLSISLHFCLHSSSSNYFKLSWFIFLFYFFNFISLSYFKASFPLRS